MGKRLLAANRAALTTVLFPQFVPKNRNNGLPYTATLEYVLFYRQRD
jgi:hypothetical protein